MVDNPEPVIDFTAQDRCDAACPARAYTLAQHDEFGELLFCTHHSRKYRQTLFDDGWTIIDDAAGLEEIGYKIPELV
jgi:hypothetical protein